MKNHDLYLVLVKEILAKYPYTFYLFGSRATGNFKKLSDFDICFFASIPPNVKAHIEEDFDESRLPVLVDLIDWNKCNDAFKKLIKNQLILLQKGDDFEYMQKMISNFDDKK